MLQSPPCESYLLKWQGDVLNVKLRLDAPVKGRAVLRTNLGAASIRRREIIEETENGIAPLAQAWSDAPMHETAPGVWECAIRLEEVGVFSAKACFFPEGSTSPVWPDGSNFHVKVAPASTRCNNSIYTVFPRQFGPAITDDPRTDEVKAHEEFLDYRGYSVIPPSGTFRDVIRRLGTIMDEMRFKIVQLLPIFPVPTTYERMGRFGCPFAATDFLSVDPACAEPDSKATPLMQFCELVDAVHAKGGLIFVDLPANHTGWASTLQIHHPEWFHREKDGSFVSPGAWGVVWADLVELDYSNAELRAYMAEVFLFWCRKGVDGFRCDAGYMIPEETWAYIVARVREEYPDTIFMLEGLGGRLEVTDNLLARAGLDWAYSELFQTYTRDQFQWYLPQALERGEKFGALVHFAETHDNDRLAKNGKTYARLRVMLAALLSQQGAWGIANGVEWFATAKIDVHGASALSWGAADNMVPLIAKLNVLLARNAIFGPDVVQTLATRGGGNTLAIVRRHTATGAKALVLANLDCASSVEIEWDEAQFPVPASGTLYDLVSDRTIEAKRNILFLEPGEVLCLAATTNAGCGVRTCTDALVRRGGAWIAEKAASPHSVEWHWPQDARREIVVPQGMSLAVHAPYPFRAEVRCGASAIRIPHSSFVYHGDGTRADRYSLEMTVFAPGGVQRTSSQIVVPPPASAAKVKTSVSGSEIRRDPTLRTVLSNGAGADAFVPVAWGRIMSQYDTLFAANPNPSVPDNRINLWTRCRIWLQHEGYSRELNSHCISRFTADPAGRFAQWDFAVPCGMGRKAAFALTLSLAPGRNAVRLHIARIAAGELDEPSSVRLVLRPDLEWRSFHDTTKAAGRVENAFANACYALDGREGFGFAPYGDGAFEMSIDGGLYHAAPEWSYMLPHPDEAERGQNDCGDVYSPGWISCDFAPGAVASICGAYFTARETSSSLRNVSFPAPPQLASSHSCTAPLPAALKESLQAFVQKRDDLKTVLAGYPWFLDWGRDTLIFLRGFIAAGHIEESLAILTAFARFEERGTIPNIIYGNTAGNRDTVDAPLWLFLAAEDLSSILGRERILSTDCGGRTLRAVLESIVANYISGTPNGICTDPSSGLVWSPAHFTWMDTNYPAGTPREGYPVEIQALWIRALRFLGGHEALASQASESLSSLFRVPGKGLADCLRAKRSIPASLAVQEDVTRPNQLFALALGVLSSPSLAGDILRATSRLIVPGGVRSAADEETRCDMSIVDNGRILVEAHHPYKGRYTGDEDTSRKPAYHNGTVWAWPFPLYAEAAAATGAMTKDEALSLLASSVENLNTSCLCHISEIADGDAPHAQKGCRAQAWSASELYRVWAKLSATTKEAS